jgi:hypothetical protein
MVIFTSAIAEIIRGGVLALDLTNRGYLAEKKEEEAEEAAQAKKEAVPATA